MRRFFTMKTPVLASTPKLGATSAAASNPLRGHSHSHSHGGGHGHAHSHGSIETNISGKHLRQCQVATLAGGATNVFFCVTKLWVGSAGDSVALVADGFHALTDILADIISYGAISLSQKKLPRCRFPFGIGRLETSGAVVVAAILFFGGVALLVQSLEHCLMDVSHLLSLASPTGGIAAALLLSVRNAVAAATPGGNGTSASAAAAGDGHGHSHNDSGSSHDGHNHSSDGHHGHSHFEVRQYDHETGKQIILWTMVGIAATSVVMKEFLFRWTRRVGLRAGSRVVVANAYHHRADAWSGGVALVGVAGQVVGLPGIDGLAGLAVSLSICKIGYGLFRDAVLEFFDYQNAEEVSAIREQLQKFNLRIHQGRTVVPVETNSAAAATSAGAATATAATPSSQDEAEAVDHKKILFTNVFLVRHGHKYALHVALLVHEAVTATQIREAIDLLTALARGSLPVQDTFTSLLLCSDYTQAREEYLGTEATEEGEEEEGPGEEAAAAAHKASADASHCDHSPVAHTAATGSIVNPSLERCIASLEEFHTFSSPIRYNWEERTLTAPSSESCECDRDVASLADMFRCRLIAAAGPAGGETTASGCTHGYANCGHTHS